MSLFSQKTEDPLDMTFMGDVDAALHRRGHPWAFTLSVSVLLFFVVVYIWAANTMLDDVVRGNGKVIPASGVRDIQSDKGGTISVITVKEGDVVTAGQVVALIANVQDVSALRDLQVRSKELELSLIRLQAETDNIPLVFSDEDRAAYPLAVQNQMQIYNSNKQLFEGEDNQLRSQIEQRKSEVAIALQEKMKLSETLALLREEEKVVRPMVGTSYSQNAYLDLRERVVTNEGELVSVEQTILSAQSAAAAAEARLNTRAAERSAAVAVEKNKNRIEMEAINQRIQSWTDQVSRAELQAPVAGTVKTVLLKQGSVARPAEVIMQILSSDDVLEIEAKFFPVDRGFLFVGQGGMAKFSSYDFSIYGGLKASVIRISDDTILDKRGEPWYEVRLLTQRKNIIYNGKELPILPGMTVTVDLLTDKRSVLDHILGPLFRAQQNAMTEH